VALILEPSDNQECVHREAMVFKGCAVDDEDGVVTNLLWRSSLDGGIGVGRTNTVSTLSPGTHTVTLSAVDAQGATGTALIAVCVLADSGTNGLPDDWEAVYWPQGNSGGNTNDPDHDGMNNYAEWVAGTIPTNASSCFYLDLSGQTGNGCDVSWPSVSNRTYMLEWSTNLQAGFQPLTNNLAADPPTNRFVDNVNTQQAVRFYRGGVHR
jgi:hypothetical protein